MRKKLLPKLSILSTIILTISCSSPCSRHFTYQVRTVDIQGIAADLKAVGTPVDLKITAASIRVDPEYVKASERLQELDLIQYALCGQIKDVEEGPFRDSLVSQYVKVLLDMAKIAQNPNNTLP